MTCQSTGTSIPCHHVTFRPLFTPGTVIVHWIRQSWTFQLPRGPMFKSEVVPLISIKVSSVESQKGAIQRYSIENQKGTINIERCSIENQKGAITIQRCSIENQKGAINIHRCSIENQKGAIVVQRQWR